MLVSRLVSPSDLEKRLVCTVAHLRILLRVHSYLVPQVSGCPRRAAASAKEGSYNHRVGALELVAVALANTSSKVQVIMSFVCRFKHVVPIDRAPLLPGSLNCKVLDFSVNEVGFLVLPSCSVVSITHGYLHFQVGTYLEIVW